MFFSLLCRIRRWWLVAALGALSLALCGSVAPTALAGDQVYFVNHSPAGLLNVKSTTGSGPLWDPNKCLGGIWSKPSAYPSLPNLMPGQTAVVTVDDGVWSPCNGVSENTPPENFAFFNGAGPPPQKTPHHASGTWQFVAVDSYALESTQVSGCGFDSGNLDKVLELTISQDGSTCTLTAAPSTPHLHFVSPLAPVRKGKAKLTTQLFTNSLRAGHMMRWAIILRQGRQTVGSATFQMSLGAPRSVLVPLNRSIQNQLKDAKRHQLAVQATLKCLSGRPASGDHRKVVLVQGRLPAGL